MEIQGYTIQSRIHEGPAVEVYRGTRNSDNLPVAIKVPRSDYPSAASLRKYRHEFEIASGIVSDRVIHYLALEEVAGKLALISEYRGEVSLEESIPHDGQPIDFFLPIAIQMVSALESVHRRQIIHKDVKPANFLITPKAEPVPDSGPASNGAGIGIRLIDLACATELTREQPSLLSPNMLEGSLPYISPEQTGRINRAIDYRTDYYSLGVSFYQMLTGRLPFEASDDMEMVHSHIARLPVSPSELKPVIPLQISRIVLRLLGKTAEERYQSTAGIMADLLECLSQWQLHHAIEEFALGRRDRTHRFVIPQKLYGREAEIGQLLQAFSRARSGAKELLFVSGFSGIGKTALIHELYKPVTQARGYFIAGKHDQYQRNVPYRALVQAFQDLVRQLLTEPESKLAQWKNRLVSALGENAQVIVDVIPEMELIVGKQPPAPELGAREARNRFNYVFQNFVKAFAAPEHPLVLFLDDLQWVDSASLQLIHLLLSDSDVTHLLLIGAYRDNEVHAGHALLIAIDEIVAEGTIPSRVQLAPMAEADVENLLRDAFQEDRIESEDSRTIQSERVERKGALRGLVTLLMNKTGGNPFFLTQFLQELYNEGLLRRDRESEIWTWEIAEIERRGMTENVVELMASKIAKLPSETQIILQRAACIGNIFELGLLSIMSARTESEATADLWPAEREGLILSASGREEASSGGRSWRFLHDRVQQAAYSSVPQLELAALHAQIGNLLIAGSSRDEREERLFTIVNHLNLGRPMAKTPESRDNLFALNMEAGIRARQGAAFEASHNYLTLAREILFERYSLDMHSIPDVEKLWQVDYDRALAAYSEEGEARFLISDFDGMRDCVDTVFLQAHNVLDKIRSHDTLLLSLVSASKTKEASAQASILLKELGHPLPMNPSKFQIARSYIYLRLALLAKSDRLLNNLPVLTNPYEAAMLRILNTAGASIYSEAPNFFPLMIFEAMNIILRHGVSPEASSFVLAYGFLLCDPLNSIELGTKFGELALGIMNRFQTSAFSARIEILHGMMIAPWTLPLLKSLADPKMLAHRALERGDLEFAATICWSQAFFSLQMGAELEQTQRTVKEIVAFVSPLQQTMDLLTTQMVGAVVEQLIGHSGPDDAKQVWGNLARIEGTASALPGSLLVSDSFDERIVMSGQEPVNSFTISSLYLFKMQIATIFGDQATALKLAEAGLTYLPSATGYISIPIYTFYHALAILGMWPMGFAREKRKRKKQLAAYLKRLKRWAKHNPLNVLHKYELIQAERARLRGRNAEAEQLYSLAATHARESKLLQDEALVHEFTARYFEQRGDKLARLSHLREARFVYEKWGARSKVEQMNKLYPEMADDENEMPESARLSTTHSASRELRGETLDLATIMKAAGALSESIELEAVLRSLIRIMIQNAGAERAVLLLMDEGELWIEAEGYAERGARPSEVEVLQHLSIGEDSGTAGGKIPVSIVQYVARVKEDVVLADARADKLFAADPYILQAAPRSVLVTPLVSQGKLTGVLYFENNLTTGAFSRDRVELLRMLSSQAAISIENARLYNDLAETNRAYSRFVPKEFLSFLQKGSIRKVQLGDQIERDMTILFGDLRSFTTMSEKMTPAENFQFLNSVLRLIGPIIREHKGFIDTYVGDAIMALFPESPEDAVRAAIKIQEALRKFSESISGTMGVGSVAMGIGIHTGKLMLGVIGEHERMQGTVIADAVNLASRIENLTKQYSASILISSELHRALPAPEKFHFRKVDCVRVKGKSRGVVLLEVLDALPPEALERRLASLATFEAGMEQYFIRNFREALPYFESLRDAGADDPLLTLYLDRVVRYEQSGVPGDWVDYERS